MREKSHRLSKDLYKGFIRATFTLCIKNKQQVFRNTSIMEEFLVLLKKAMEKHKANNWVYMFMPDHIHLILEGIDKDSDLWKCVVLFKQLTGYWFSKNMSEIEWQKDFYDHIHRKDEDLIKHIRYILENPVRQGIVSEIVQYPYKGSLSYNVEELVNNY